MKAQYRFIAEKEKADLLKSGASIELSLEDSHKIHNVLRLVAGQPIEVICPITQRAFEAKIIGENKKLVTVELLAELENSAAQFAGVSTLYVGSCKGDKNDFICQKASELGVEQLCFINCDRSVSRVTADKAAEKIKRWDKISRAAIQQSHQSRLPQIRVYQNLAEIFAAGSEQKILFCAPQGENILSVALPNNKLALLVGPEGGFSNAELELITENCLAVSLGASVLRAETAAILALGVLNLRLATA